MSRPRHLRAWATGLWCLAVLDALALLSLRDTRELPVEPPAEKFEIDRCALLDLRAADPTMQSWVDRPATPISWSRGKGLAMAFRIKTTYDEAHGEGWIVVPLLNAPSARLTNFGYLKHGIRRTPAARLTSRAPGGGAKWADAEVRLVGDRIAFKYTGPRRLAKADFALRECVANRELTRTTGRRSVLSPRESRGDGVDRGGEVVRDEGHRGGGPLDGVGR